MFVIAVVLAIMFFSRGCGCGCDFYLFCHFCCFVVIVCSFFQVSPCFYCFVVCCVIVLCAHVLFSCHNLLMYIVGGVGEEEIKCEVEGGGMRIR